MDNTFLAPPRRVRTRVVAAVVGLAVVLGTVALLARAGRHDNRRTPVGAAPTPIAAHGTGTPAAGRHPLSLVRGSETVNGVSVGYPHTFTGAVSAAVEYSIETGSTLDPQRAAQIAQATTDSSFGDASAYYIHDITETRRQLGLSTEGPLPAGASMTFGPVSYQTRNARADEVTVLLLSYLTITTPSAGIEERTILLPVRMVWFNGDWKIGKRPDDAPEYLELLHKPGSAQALAAGWQDFTR